MHQLENLKTTYKKSREKLITETNKSTGNIMVNRRTIIREQKWKEKQLYGYFKRQTSEISHGKTWKLLRKGNFKRENASL